MPSTKKLLQAAAGSAGGDPLYVEDVFSTYLYDGNGSNRSITNGIDLAGEGGLVWAKMRSGTPSGGNNVLYDTERGAGKYLISDLTSAQSATDSVALTSFNSNGFSLGVDNASGLINYATRVYASWSFRKAEKFFDVQTWTGNGVAGRQIPHSLGSTPRFIITKRTDGADNWKCYHVGNPSPAEDHVIELDNSNAAGNESIWNDTAPTSTNFTVSAGGAINANGYTYVAYLFASDAGGFGGDGDENIIKCGSYTGNGNVTGPLINLGFEPQFVLIKAASRTGHWFLLDVLRGISTGTSSSSPGTNQYLLANSSGPEGATTSINVNSTGFQPRTTDDSVNENAATYIYIAIRRPMKTPESGTEVFAMDTADGTPLPQYESGFVTDFEFNRSATSAAYTAISSRLTGNEYLRTNDTNAGAPDNDIAWDFMDGWGSATWTLAGQYSWMFKRATGCMDVVAYSGNGTAGTTQAHNLGVAPEMMIVKVRNIVEPWAVYHTGLNDGVTPQNYHIRLTNGAEAADSDIWNNTAPTSSVFTTGGNDKVNANGGTYIAYLFATLAGVSKVGSYTGTGSDLNVDCGFSAGARFILIKRSDSAGDWHYWDSSRGISASTDPYLLLNSDAAQVTNTDYIDPLSSGFTVTSSAPAALNASGSNYIFLAIA